MKAVIVSFFDTNNMGDLLISDLLYKKAKRHFEEVDAFHYLNGKEVDHSREISIESYDANTQHNRKNFRTKVSELLVSSKLLPLNYFYLSKLKKYDLADFENKIKDADVLLIGGGNMIFDMFKKTLGATRFNQYISLAKKHNKKVFAISLGIGPFQTKFQERKAVKALSECDYVTFRDEKSYNIYLRNNPKNLNNVHISVDPVFNYTQKIEYKGNNNTIGINIINNPVYNNNKSLREHVINGYVQLINKFREDDKNILLFSTETRDYEVIKEVYSRLYSREGTDIIAIHNEEDLLELYSKLDVLIGTRMHSMIVAYTQMIPIIGLAWQPKVRAMFEIIEEKGSYFELTDLLSVVDSIIRLTDEKISTYDCKLQETKLQNINMKDLINEEILKKLSLIKKQ